MDKINNNNLENISASSQLASNNGANRETTQNSLDEKLPLRECQQLSP